MSEEVTNEAVSDTEDPAETVTKKRGGGPVLWLFALISLLALALSVLVYLQVSSLQTLATDEPAGTQQLRQDIESLALALAETQRQTQQLAGQLAGIQQQQSELSAGLGSLFQQQDMDNEDWALAEIEHLLIIATHRLQLEHDVPMALAAMQAADNRLRSIDDPRLLPVRQRLIADMNALLALEVVDITGLVLFLSDLAGRVNDLPLAQVQVVTGTRTGAGAGAEAAPAEQGSRWQRLQASIWQELKSLVQISRRGQDTRATLMPEQRYFLYQNLRLQLESARYAVLRRDTDNLHVSIEFVTSWLNDYFDTDDSSVANIIESLSKMLGLKLDPVLPDISSSLETLRAYMRIADAGEQSLPTEQ